MPKLNLILALIIGLFLPISSCDLKKSDNADGSYIRPSIDYKGKMRKGHVRRKISTQKNAIKKRMQSRYYYHTRGKYRRKKK